MNPIAIIMTGIPGAGKTTVRKQIVEGLVGHTAFDLCAPDDLVDAVAEAKGSYYRDIYTQDQVRNICYDASLHRLDAAIKSQRNVICDRTYINFDQRARLMVRFVGQPYHFISVSVELPVNPKEWVHRLDKRVGKEIPGNTLLGMIRTMDQPIYEEGFNTLFSGTSDSGLAANVVEFIRETSL